MEECSIEHTVQSHLKRPVLMLTLDLNHFWIARGGCSADAGRRYRALHSLRWVSATGNHKFAPKSARIVGPQLMNTSTLSACKPRPDLAHSIELMQIVKECYLQGSSHLKSSRSRLERVRVSWLDAVAPEDDTAESYSSMK